MEFMNNGAEQTGQFWGFILIALSGNQERSLTSNLLPWEVGLPVCSKFRGDYQDVTQM
jgi:hypothetical protein